MKKKLLFIMLTFVLSSCFSSASAVNYTKNKISKADIVVANALKYKGVKYKYGGTTRKGMDCSGVVFVSFGEENIALPRSSRYMAKEGKKIALAKVKKGDLLFFKISRRSNQINHVGLVTEIKNGQIFFIHATTSRGVIVSSMSEKYWKNTFVKASNVL
ncbi:glycoside hydrolase [Polaribacter reichenbachii]|uniref:Glycoside hydrolase n=1 Tax=Polaribacter reichenbachii TaxID=996801 RepID=A0A1B8TRU9_9FLAO|nr:C40 family peptidase [Polaribacter reichenbachii]APZ44913.1 glycoside hydrolase [Polaribacter reichenbachii]AUC18777.1 glycoside hydrolase [Polaribacter reichenbachii]OBY62393.1 glycoside hydrolase [Polaribacter reichenbachii]